MDRKFLLCIFLLLLIASPIFPLTIFDIQFTTDPGGNSPYEDSVVTVIGIATVSQDIFYDHAYYIQDGEGLWNGIMIYDTDTTRGIEEGDILQVTGTVSEYYGKTEIGYLDDVTVISKGNELPCPYLVQTGEIDTAEAYEGVLIRCANVVVTDPNIGYGEWLIDDGSGECRVDDAANYSYSPTLFDTILHIIGIVDYSYSNFKIEPRGDGDIIQTLDGTGKAYIDPDYVPNGYTLTEEITILAAVDTLRSYSITIPFEWQWSGSSSDVALSGSGNTGAAFAVSGTGVVSDPFVIIVTATHPTERDSAIISINNLITPDSFDTYIFQVMTAGMGGTLTPIPIQPEVSVQTSDGSGIVTVVPDEVTDVSIWDLQFQLQTDFGILQSIALMTPQFWEWTGNAQDISLLGDGFQNAHISVSIDTLLNTYIIAIDSAMIDPSNNGIIEIRNFTTPDLFGFYTFEIQTAGPGGNLQSIAHTPEVLVRRSDGTIPIIAVDRNDSTGVPHLLGKYVRVGGVVTVADEFGGQSHIQDATGGVCVYGIEGNFAPGDTVTVSGTVYQYYGLTELSPSTFELFHGRGGNPAPGTVTCYDITTDGIGGIEKYEGELVMIRNVTTGASVFPSEGNMTVTDSSGSCEVRIKEETDLPGVETPDSAFDIIGIVSQYKYNSPYIGGYQLMPRSLQDIIKRGDGSGNTVVNPPYVNAQDTSFLEFSITAGLDTIEKVSITIPLEWYWSGNKMDIVLSADGFAAASCDTVMGDGITKVFEIVIDGAVIFADAAGVVTIRNLSSNGITGTWAFPVKTACHGGFVKEIYILPSVFSVLKIADVQEPGSDGYSSCMEGDSVYVAGVVTGPSSAFSSGTFNSFYIQDATGGVNIYSGEGRGFYLSEMTIVRGIITEYNGLTEVSTYPEKIYLLDEIAGFAPSLLSLNQGIREALEGRLLRIENGIVATKPSVAGAGRNFQIYNGRTIIDIRVNDGTGIDLSDIAEGKRVNVTGIAGQYDSEAPYSSGYQLLPRFSTDIEISGEGGEAGDFSLFIYPNPFSHDLGEIATIEVNSPDPDHDRLSLLIYDLKGRLVKRIFSNLPGGFSTHFWYGRNKNLRSVPVGIYIAHLERKKSDGGIEALNKSIIVGTP